MLFIVYLFILNTSNNKRELNAPPVSINQLLYSNNTWCYRMITLCLLAFMAGAAIALQASMNAQLGILLQNSLLGTTVAFTTSLLFCLIIVILTTKHYPHKPIIDTVPIYLWVTGGALSAFGVAMFYYLIPKMGLSNTVSYALTGQLLVAVLISHFGWFDLPVKSFDITKLSGSISLIVGIILINWK